MDNKIKVDFTKDIKKKSLKKNFEFLLNYYLGRVELTEKRKEFYNVMCNAQCNADNVIYIAWKVGLIEYDEYKRLYAIIFRQIKM